MGDKIRLLICGSRIFTNKAFVSKCVGYHKNDIEVIISGHAPGADACGECAARDHKIPLEIYPADWATYGKAAGIIRNQEMLEKGKPTEVWAFSDDIVNSRGTTDMIRRALGANLPVYLLESNSIRLFSSVESFESFLSVLRGQPSQQSSPQE